MNQRETNKRIVAELFDGRKSSYEIAKIIKTLTGKSINQRTVERYEQELRADGKIGNREGQTRDSNDDEAQTKKEYYAEAGSLVANLKSLLSSTKPYTLPKQSKFKKGDTLNILISDWHIGRLIKDENGTTIYNVEVAKTQIKAFIEETLTLLDNYISKGTPISNVNILSVGDILDGMGIFASQETLSELSPPFQVFEAVKLLQEFILALMERKLEVSFYGVKGNHGEIRVNGKAPDPSANWDMVLYLVLDFWSREVLKGKGFTVNYSELDYLNFNNRGWIYHLRHIAPSQSETSGGKAKFLGWVKKHGCSVVAYGHFHHWGIWDRSGITVIRGGALTAGDEFAESLAEESEPIQVIWGCNEKRPVTFVYPVDLGVRKK